MLCQARLGCPCALLALIAGIQAMKKALILSDRPVHLSEMSPVPAR